jgi:UDP-2-acetamido-2,6-beta-L-arabino-hexul-4-ose reductase
MNMPTILVTGSAGFIGKHLMDALGRRPDVRVIGYDVGYPPSELDQGLAEADFIFHLAGVNRPQQLEEFKTGNADFTASLCAKLAVLGRTPTLVMASSIQAELENPYGVSKRQAEEALRRWAEGEGSRRSQQSEDVGRRSSVHPRVVIFRLKNVFGKWCRPNYNSVTATFCHNIAHDLPITISDPNKELDLVYIDDVVAAFIATLDENLPSPALFSYREVPRSFKLTLGELAATIRSFRASRTTLVMPSFADALTRCLYATYLSHLDGADFGYNLEIKTDNRGCLAEFMKSTQFGQIFVSRTKPGITRGNHYHHTKTEKFLVVEGEAVLRFRSTQQVDRVQLAEVIEHRVSGRDFRVVDIPPGYTHSIENVGNSEMVVLFWASECYDPAKPDTTFLPVLGDLNSRRNHEPRMDKNAHDALRDRSHELS